MWVWRSIRPGSTVRPDQSTLAGPSLSPPRGNRRNLAVDDPDALIRRDSSVRRIDQAPGADVDRRRGRGRRGGGEGQCERKSCQHSPPPHFAADQAGVTSASAGAVALALIGTLLEHLVDQPEFLGLVGLEELVAVHRQLDRLDLLAGILGVERVEALSACAGFRAPGSRCPRPCPGRRPTAGGP